MKYWMLAAICSGLCVSVSASAGGNSGPNEDSTVVAEQVFRDGLAYCNQASKLSRTDAPAARTHIAQYLHHLEQAMELAPETVKSNGFIQRESKRCTLVEDNIARLEAMTLAETSLQRCADARTALEKGALSQAQTKFDEYQLMSQQAVAITPTVMRVGSLGVQFRRCDQMVEKISLAKVKRARIQRETEHALAGYSKVLDSCAEGEVLLQSSVPNEHKMQASARILGQLSQQLQNADQRAAELIQSALTSGTVKNQALSERQAHATACQQELVARFNQIHEQIQQPSGLGETAAVTQQSNQVAQPEELPGPYAASADGAAEITVEGGVVQLGAPEF